jgi:hypothetical protein
MVSVPWVARHSHVAEVAQCVNAQAFKANSAGKLAV